MNTKEAIHAMIDGKKVKRKHWTEGVYTYAKGAMFFNQTGDIINSFGDSNDWEIYKDPKQKEKVTIEKWLCIEDGENYCTYEGDTNYFNAIENFETKKVKLLDTYDVDYEM